MKKMRFPRPYKRRKNITLVISIGVCVVIVIVAAIQPAFMTSALLYVTGPFLGARDNISTDTESFFGGFASRRALVEENATLREKLLQAEIKSDLYDTLRRGYERTDTATTSISHTRTGRVIETPPFSPYDTVLIDIGTAAGVSVGDSVSLDATIALGIVDSVSKNTSRVRLFSSPGYEQEVRIGIHDFIAVAHGKGGGTFEIAVPKEIAVVRGDHIFLSNGEFVGVVKQVVESDAEAFVTVSAVLPENIFELRTVLVLLQDGSE